MDAISKSPPISAEIDLSTYTDLVRELIFDVPGTPPGENTMKSWHWAKVARSNSDWKGWTLQACRDAANRSHLGPFPWPAATMLLEFFFATSTRRDLPNLAGAGKPIVDGVVEAKVIPDDSYIYLHGYATRVSRKLVPQPFVRVTVRRVSAALGKA